MKHFKMETGATPALRIIVATWVTWQIIPLSQFASVQISFALFVPLCVSASLR
jgi:hypothetical protein